VSLDEKKFDKLEFDELEFDEVSFDKMLYRQRKVSIRTIVSWPNGQTHETHALGQT
jgi:hypothetical protein